MIHTGTGPHAIPNEVTSAPPAKDVMQTRSGRVLKPLDLWPGDFDLWDIAWSLAHQCRYNGHTKMFYSVATHSMLVAKFLPDSLTLDGLLHDASEAYLTDLPSPVKMHMPEYRAMEEKVQDAILLQFGLPFPQPPEVKWADDYVFCLESPLVMGGEIARRFGKPDSPHREIVEKTILTHAQWAPAVVADHFYLALRTSARKVHNG